MAAGSSPLWEEFPLRSGLSWEFGSRISPGELGWRALAWDLDVVLPLWN